MEGLNLSTKVRKSIKYRRHKSFMYKISRDEDKTLAPGHPAYPIIFLQDESTSPSPMKKLINLTNPYPASAKCPLSRNISPLSLNLKILKQHSACFEAIQCKTEIPVGMLNHNANGLSYSSIHSPVSSRVNLSKGNNFSKMTDKYESSPLFDPSDFPPTARSGMYLKENSLEISAISEENSFSEPNLGKDISAIEINDKNSSSVESENVISSVKLSEKNIPIERVSSLSLPSSNILEDDYDLRGKLPFQNEENSINQLVLSFEEALKIFKTIKIEYINQNL